MIAAGVLLLVGQFFEVVFDNLLKLSILFVSLEDGICIFYTYESGSFESF